jgi:hypothetical protein
LNRQGNPPGPPFGSAQLAALAWREPVKPLITPERRAAEQARLEGLSRISESLGYGTLDVEAEVQKLGPTAEEVAAQRQAESQAKVDESINRAFDEAEARLDDRLKGG